MVPLTEVRLDLCEDRLASIVTCRRGQLGVSVTTPRTGTRTARLTEPPPT
jgi:hypothetical protein